MEWVKEGSVESLGLDGGTNWSVDRWMEDSNTIVRLIG